LIRALQPKDTRRGLKIRQIQETVYIHSLHHFCWDIPNHFSCILQYSPCKHQTQSSNFLIS